MKTFFDLFSGGGGAAQGAKQAGLTPVGGVEIDPEIAAIYAANHGDHLTVGDVLSVRPGQFDRPDWFHASPVCKSFSAAKTNGKEHPIDVACAEKVAEFIEAWRPQYFSLENVSGYARSRSFEVVVNALHQGGYFPQWSILNAADYGVAQSRRRLILLAVRGGFVPPPPPPTPWIGWYEAIADLIPTLPESKLADWQIRALPQWVRESVLVRPSEALSRIERSEHEPSFTLSASATGTHQVRALLIHPTDQRTCPTPEGDTPAFTLTGAIAQTGNYPRALLIEGRNPRNPTIRAGNQPASTLPASITKGMPRALLIENTGARSDRPLQIRPPESPCWTIRAMGKDGHWHRATAIEEGRVVALTIPALARLQSFPDDYRWSGRKPVDGVAIGNSVCPQFFEGVIRNVLKS